MSGGNFGIILPPALPPAEYKLPITVANPEANIEVRMTQAERINAKVGALLNQRDNGETDEIKYEAKKKFYELDTKYKLCQVAKEGVEDRPDLDSTDTSFTQILRDYETEAAIDIDKCNRLRHDHFLLTTLDRSNPEPNNLDTDILDDNSNMKKYANWNQEYNWDDRDMGKIRETIGDYGVVVKNGDNLQVGNNGFIPVNQVYTQFKLKCPAGDKTIPVYRTRLSKRIEVNNNGQIERKTINKDVLCPFGGFCLETENLEKLAIPSDDDLDFRGDLKSYIDRTDDPTVFTFRQKNDYVIRNTRIDQVLNTSTLNIGLGLPTPPNTDITLTQSGLPSTKVGLGISGFTGKVNYEHLGGGFGVLGGIGDFIPTAGQGVSFSSNRGGCVPGQPCYTDYTGTIRNDPSQRIKNILDVDVNQCNGGPSLKGRDGRYYCMQEVLCNVSSRPLYEIVNTAIDTAASNVSGQNQNGAQ